MLGTHEGAMPGTAMPACAMPATCPLPALASAARLLCGACLLCAHIACSLPASSAPASSLAAHRSNARRAPSIKSLLWVEIRGDVRAMFAEYLTDLDANLERRRARFQTGGDGKLEFSWGEGFMDSEGHRASMQATQIWYRASMPLHNELQLLDRPTRYARATADLSATEYDRVDRVADFLVSSESLVARWSGTARYGPQDQCSPQRGSRA